jgi:hypothetical protein
MNNQRGNFIIPYRPNQTAGAQIHYPVKASGDLKKNNFLLLPYIAAYTYGFDKKGIIDI